jgi:hypothetical protein
LGELVGMQASKGKVASVERARTPRSITRLWSISYDWLCQFKTEGTN